MLPFHTRLFLLLASIGTAALAAQPVALPFKPLDVQYSKSLDRLIMITADPKLVHIVNPLTGAETTITLSLQPLSLSVSPNGTHAAVGHDGWISYVNLQAGYVEKNLAVSVRADSLVLAGNGNVWIPPVTTVNLATGVQSGTSYGPWTVNRPALHPNGNWIYYTRGGSPDDVIKGDISSGTFQYLYDSKYHGDFSICSGIYYSADGNRLLTGCGTLFRTTSTTDDLTYNGALSAAPMVAAAADSSITRKLIVIPGNPYYGSAGDIEVQFYENEYLSLLGRVALPPYAPDAPWHGRHLFYSPDASKLYIVLQADAKANLTNDYAIYTLALSSGPACSPSLAANSTILPATGGKVDVSVTATAGCLWQATSNASWLTIDAGGVTSGGGAVTIRAIPNILTTPRTGTVTIAGLAYSVTQSESTTPGTTPLIQSPVRPAAAGYSAALDRMILVSASPHLLTILDPVTANFQTVALPLPPTSLSVSTDGIHAAVGHDGRISYVNLATAALEKTYSVTTSVFDLALGAREIYAFPLRDQWSDIRIVNLATGAESLWNHIYAGGVAGKISPNGKYLYLNATKRYDISQALPAAFDAIIGASPLQWFSQDGSRLFSGAGTAYRLSDVASQDLQYNGTLDSNGLAAVADSSAQRLTAVIVNRPPNDTSIKFFGQQYLATVGSLVLPKFTFGAKSYNAHGRHLFWNAAGNRLFAVVQADETSGLLNDYAILRVSLDASCGASLERSNVSVPASGGSFSVAVTANAGCAWKSATNVPWITISANAVSAGSATLTFIVDANLTTMARSATIAVEGQTLSVDQAAGTQAQVTALTPVPFRVTDAEYSLSLDRLVALSGSPNRLNIYDPATSSNVPVSLPLPGNAVSVAPNGLRAAVCHDGLVSLINLQSATIEKSVNSSLNCRDIVLAGNGYAYLSAIGGNISSIDLSTGLETKLDAYYGSPSLQLNPAGDAVYLVDSAVWGGPVTRYKITGGPMTRDYTSQANPSGGVGGKFWFTRDGRVVGNTASVFRSGSTEDTDFKYMGSLSGYTPGPAATVGVAHSVARRLFASIGPGTTPSSTDTSLLLHGDKYLALSSRMPLPKLTMADVSAASHGRFVFFNSTGLKAYVILQAEPAAGFLNDFAVYTLSPDFSTGCTLTLGIASGTAVAQGGPGGVAVNATANDCVWEAKSNASWIQLDGGTLGIGMGNVSYSVLPNFTALARTGTITIGTQTYTIAQAGSTNTACTLSVNRTSLTTSAAGDSLQVPVTASGTDCTWGAQSDISWITLPNPGATTGSGIVRITVAPNPETTARNAQIDIAGIAVTVTQAAAGCSFTISSQSLAAPASGSTGSLNVTTTQGCNWLAASAPSWIAVDIGSTGSGTLNYNITANQTALPKSGAITVADKVIQVIQAGQNPAPSFQDVPLSHMFFNQIGLLKGTGVTKGCTETSYCPEETTTRAQMAAFLVRAMVGDVFESATTPYFKDVPATHPFFRYIQKLRELGITAGCSVDSYCPADPVSRGQMAAFIIRARLGLLAGDPLTHTTTPYFADAPATHPFFSYIQKMRDLGITTGITPTTYGPENLITRGQMAVFLIRGLLTP